MGNWILITVLIIGVGLALCLFYGIRRRKIELEHFHKSMIRALPRNIPSRVDLGSLESLPGPVKRYFRNVLTQDQPYIRSARLQQNGALKISPKAKKWAAFQATQWMTQNPPAFIWDAKIRLGPSIHVRVRDSFSQGIGSGQVSLFSAFSMGREADRPELNAAAFFRYLAEAVWQPTALLPAAGIQWQAVDQRRSMARITYSGLSIALEFRFNDRDEITGIYTENRYGKFGKDYFRYPWEGRFGKYKVIQGMKIPTVAEVGWHLPDGWWLFWKGEILSAEFDFHEEDSPPK